ncbi:hypothetical protein ACN24M_20390 [Streptomyces microflavus]
MAAPPRGGHPNPEGPSDDRLVRHQHHLPDGLSDEEYRDWVANNVSPEAAEDYWYAVGAQ